MSTIDNRIVEMQFNNQQFEQNIQQSIKSLDALKKGLDFDESEKSLDDFQKASNKFNMDAVTSSIEKVGRHLTSFATMLKYKVFDRMTDSVMDFGKKTLKSLTIEPVGDGFKEYELKMDSVQTIMASTGESLETVNRYLDELNTYADRTIYSFSDMTENIGKFTNAGIDLDSAVKAIQGISNVAAVSGANTNEASRAMYNFSQALSAGYVKLIDWKSIENANMATVEFKNHLLETAVSMGTLKKTSDGMYRTLKGHTFNATQEFNDNLQDQWMTSEVLVATLGQYSDETTEIGKKAFAAAQDVKTFTQMMDTLKESVGSGWATTFEIIFGNLEEAKELWTGVSKAIGGIIDASSDSRNVLLQEWKDLGGRDALIQGLTDAFHGLWGIVMAVKEALTAIFPPITAQQLVDLSNKIRDAGESISQYFNWWSKEEKRLSSEEVDVDTSDAVESIEELDRTLRNGDRGDDVKKLQERLKQLGYAVGEVDGIFGPKTRAALEKFQKDNDLVADGVFGKKSFAKLTEILGIGNGEEKKAVKTYKTITETVTGFGKAISYVQRFAKGVFSVFGVIFNAAKTGVQVIWKVVSAFSPLFEVVLAIGGIIGDFLSGFSNWVKESGIFESIVETITQWIQPLADGIKSVSDWLLGLLGVNKVAEDTEGALNGVQTTFGKLIDTVKNSKVWKALITFINKVKDGFKKATPVLKDFWNKVKNYFSENFPDLIPNIKAEFNEFMDDPFGFVKGLVTKIPSLLEPVGEFFGGIGDFFVDSLSGSSLSQKLNPYLTKSVGIKDVFTDIINSVVTSIKDFGSGIAKPFQTVGQKFDEIKGQIATFWGKATSKISEIYDKVKEFLSGIDFGEIISKTILTLGSIQVVRLIGAITKFTNSIAGIATSVQGIVSAGTKVVEAATVIPTKIGEVIGSFTGIGTSLTGFVNQGTETLKNLPKMLKNLNKKTDPIGTTILKIAASVLIIAAAIWFIGTQMNEDQLKQGIAVVGGIFAALLIFSIAVSKFVGAKGAKALGKLADALKGFALIFGVLVAAIWLLGTRDMDVLEKGFGSLIVIMLLLGIFIIAVNKLSGEKKMKFDGLVGMAFAIAILAIIVWRLGKLDIVTLGKGLLGLLGIMAILGLFVIAVNRIGGESKVKYGGLIALAFAVGILAIIMWRISAMDDDAIGRGLKGLLGVMGILAVFVIAVNRIGGESKVKYGGLLALSFAVAILTIIMWRISEMSDESIDRGLKGLGGIMGMLGVFVVAVERLSGQSSFKMGGLLALSIAIGILAIIMWALSNMDQADIDKGMSTLRGIMTMLGVFVIAVNRFSGQTNALNVGGLFVVAVIIAALASIMYLISFMSWDDIEKGMTGLITVMGSMTAVVAASGKMTIGSGVGALIACVGVAIVIGVIAASLYVLNKYEVDVASIEALCDGVSLVIGAMAAMIRLSKGIDIKSAVSLLIVCAGVAALMGVLAYSLYQLGNSQNEIDTAMIEQVCNGMAILVGATAALVAAGKGFELKNVLPTLIVLVVVIGLIAGIVALLANFPAIGEGIGKAASVIGDIFGQFAGSFEAAKTKKFNDAMSGLEVNDVDDEKLQSMLDDAKKINEFQNELPEPSKIDKIGNWISGKSSSPLSIFAEGVSAFSDAMKSIFDVLKDDWDYETLEAKLTDLLNLAGQINDFSKKLPELSLLEKFGADTELERFSKDMTSFGQGFHSLVVSLTSISPLDYSTFNLRWPTFNDVVESINKFQKTLPEYSKSDKSILGKSDLEQFSNDISDFGEGFKGLVTALGTITDEDYQAFKSRWGRVYLTAWEINIFQKTLPDYGTWERVPLIGSTALETFSNDLKDFGKGFSHLAQNIGEIKDEDYQAFNSRWPKVKEAANDLNEFNNSLPSELKTNNLKFWESSPLETFSSGMAAFGPAFATMAESLLTLSPISVWRLEFMMDPVCNAASDLNDFASKLPKMTFGDYVASWAHAESPMEAFASDIAAFGEGFSTFATKMGCIKPWAMNRIDTEWPKVKNACDKVIEIDKGIPEYTFTERIGLFKTSMESFSGDISAFGDGYSKFANAMASITKPVTEEQANTAVACAESVARFFNTLGTLDDIEADKNVVAQFFTGDTNLNTVLAKIPEFGTNVADAGKSLGAISQGTFADDVKIAMDFLQRLVLLFRTADTQGLSFNTEALDSFVSNISLFGTNVKSASDSISGFAAGTFAADAAAATDMLSSLVDIFRITDGVSFSVKDMKSAIGQIDDLGTAMKKFDGNTDGVNVNNIAYLSGSVKSIADGLYTFATTDIDSGLDKLDSALTRLQEILSNDDQWNYTGKAVADAVTSYSNTLTTSLTTNASAITEDVSAFSDAGASLGSAVTQGMSANIDTSSIKSICSACVSAVKPYEGDFNTAGRYLSAGLARGIRDGGSSAIEAAKSVARSALTSANFVLGVSSPSKKFAEIGMYCDEGLSEGLLKYSRAVDLSANDVTSSMLDTAKGGLSTLSGLLSDDIDADPVIRPVLDLTNVASGARAIGGIIPRSSTIDIGTTTSKAGEASASMNAVRSGQNGTTSSASSSVSNTDSSVNFSGNTFNVRSEQDVHNLAAEIAALTKQQQRSMGAVFGH